MPKATAPNRPRLAFVVAQFNAELTHAMRDDAARRAKELRATIVHEHEVAGVFDLPLVAQELARRPDVDAVVAIGAIITGETAHDNLIAHACGQGLVRVALETGKPIGLGVTGPGQTYPQAQARIDRGGAAVESVVKQLQTLAVVRSRR
jgi:6,7-dimethyl-8-ribityllumazine synthase